MNKRVLLAGGLLLFAAVWAAVPAVAQKRGGVVNWFVYADPSRLDLFTETPLAVQQVTAGVYSGLLQFDPRDPGKIVPDLATSYEASNGGKTYTFTLRQGVKWHDGKPFTSADVKATFDRILAPNFRAPRCGSVVRPVIDSVETMGPHQVRFNLKFGAATFVPAMASAWCRIAAKHILERDGNLMEPKSQIGTGPFKFKRYERGTIIEWERNPDYYNPQLPYVEGVRQFVLQGATRQLAAAKAGRLHIWDTWPPMKKSAAQELRGARGDEVEVYTHPLNTLWAVHFNTQKPPFHHKDLRQAVNLALDRHELFEKAFEGIGVPCAILDPKLYGDWALPLAELNRMPGCRKDKSEDIAKAKALVEKHYPGGLDLEVVTRTVGNYVDRAQLVASQLRKISIRPTIKTYESAAGYSAFGQGDFNLIVAQDTAMFLPDPAGTFGILFTSVAGRNWGKHSDPYIDEMAEKGLREQDPAKRRQIYHDLQRYILTEGGSAVVVGWVEGWYFRDKRLRGYVPAPTVYDNNTFQTVWLEQ